MCISYHIICVSLHHFSLVSMTITFHPKLARVSEGNSQDYANSRDENNLTSINVLILTEICIYITIIQSIISDNKNVCSLFCNVIYNNPSENQT